MTAQLSSALLLAPFLSEAVHQNEAKTTENNEQEPMRTTHKFALPPTNPETKLFLHYQIWPKGDVELARGKLLDISLIKLDVCNEKHLYFARELELRLSHSSFGEGIIIMAAQNGEIPGKRKHG